MSDSDSDGAGISIPPRKIEQALRDAANDIFKRDPDNLTLKRVRIAAEEQLELEDGWFKTNSKWNARSKELIQKHVEKLEEDQEKGVTNQAASPVPAVEHTNEGSSPSKKKRTSELAKREGKRSVPDTKPKPRKKRKVSESEVEDDTVGELSELSEEDVPTTSKTKRLPKPNKNGKKASKAQEIRNPKAKVVSKPEEERQENVELPKPTPQSKPTPLPKEPVKVDVKPDKIVADDSSSELSSFIDEPPPPKKKRQKKSLSPGAMKSSKPKPAKSKSKPAESSDTNAEEIKRLQGWLVKCGIKKVWGKELAPYSTPPEKIAHLKDMLRDVGMDGRYSVEKARQIKEARELAADLEAVKDFDERWGSKEGEEHDGAGTRKRGAAKLLVDFSDDDEDSD